mgnify:CR=1 FL=1
MYLPGNIKSSNLIEHMSHMRPVIINEGRGCSRPDIWEKIETDPNFFEKLIDKRTIESAGKKLSTRG